MDCPLCHRPMREAEYEGVLIQLCDRCGGEFVGSRELAHIVQTRERRFPDVNQEILAQIKPQFGVPAAEKERMLACPQCGEQMQVVNYCGDSGIYVDRCGRCGGVWLDHEELENVQVLMEQWADEAPEQIRALAGELEAARQQEASRTSRAFAGSRFAFVNALINSFLDAA